MKPKFSIFPRKRQLFHGICIDSRFRFDSPTTKGAFGSDFQDAQIAYELGRSIAGMRADDVLNCARYGAERATGDRDGTVELVAIGNVGVSALHAAALEPTLFQSVKIRQMIVSWAKIVHNRKNSPVLMGGIIHGTLQYYDLPNLETVLNEKLTIEQPIDDMGKPYQNGK